MPFEQMQGAALRPPGLAALSWVLLEWSTVMFESAHLLAFAIGPKSVIAADCALDQGFQAASTGWPGAPCSPTRDCQRRRELILVDFSRVDWPFATPNDADRSGL